MTIDALNVLNAMNARKKKLDAQAKEMDSSLLEKLVAENLRLVEDNRKLQSTLDNLEAAAYFQPVFPDTGPTYNLLAEEELASILVDECRETGWNVSSDLSSGRKHYVFRTTNN